MDTSWLSAWFYRSQIEPYGARTNAVRCRGRSWGRRLSMQFAAPVPASDVIRCNLTGAGYAVGRGRFRPHGAAGERTVAGQDLGTVWTPSYLTHNDGFCQPGNAVQDGKENTDAGQAQQVGCTVARNASGKWPRQDGEKAFSSGRRGSSIVAGRIIWAVALVSLCTVGGAMDGGTLVVANSGSSGAMSSPAYANAFEQWNIFSKRTSTSPVTFRLQAETKFGWEVCVTGGCEALGYWDPAKALLLRTDPSRYPIWEGVGQLPGGCDIEYKYLMRPRGRCEGAKWEDCDNRIIRTTTIEKAILLVTDPDKMTPDELSRQEMVTGQYFKEWTTLAAPFASTLIFNTARPHEEFKELLEDEAFQRPCALVFCRDSGTEIFVRDYETPQLAGVADDTGEPLLDTRPELPHERPPQLAYPNEAGWRVGSDVNSLD